MFLKKTIPLFALVLPLAGLAQNTIGGQAKLVPEAEVNRQSDFLDAERERIIGHWDKAIEAYKTFLRENPGNAAAWYGMARCEWAKQNPEGALEPAQKAATLEPANFWYQTFLAEVYEKLGRPRDAAAIYAGLTKQQPQNQDFLRQLAYYEVLAGNPQGGLRALDQLEKIGGVSEETADKKHLIYLNLDEPKKAAAELQKLADAFPAQLEYRHHLARFYLEQGDKPAARKVYEDILRRDPADRQAQMALLERNKNAEETAFLQSLLPIFRDPQAPIDAKIEQILPYLSGLKPGMAVSDVMQELALTLETAHPSDAKAWSVSGAVQYQLNRPAEALEKYRQCLRLNPNVFGAWENTLTILDQLERYDEMLSTAEKALDAFPNQPKAYWLYGIAATEKGRFDDAASQLEQALLMTGNNTGLRLEILDQLAVALTRKKDLAAAAIRFEQAMQIKGSDRHAGLLEHYGDLLLLRGDKKAAAEQWQKAYDVSQNPAILQKIKGI